MEIVADRKDRAGAGTGNCDLFWDGSCASHTSEPVETLGHIHPSKAGRSQVEIPI